VARADEEEEEEEEEEETESTEETRIAPHMVIAGLDPAIREATLPAWQYLFGCCNSSWMRGQARA
jgi:hypothetical protein